MKVCGIEINSNDVNLCLLALAHEIFELPDCRARKLTLKDASSTPELRHFQQTFAKLMADYQVDHVVIRQRPMKGKFAGGAVGFKLEAAIELISDLKVTVMSTADIKDSLKRNPIQIEYSDTGLKAFQEVAFHTAYAFLMKDKYDPQGT